MIVLKGTQISLPPYFRCGKDISWIYEFELPENGYDVGNTKEQEDWLKLTGVKPKFFDPMYDSRMIGFRWDLKLKKYEYCFYWHDKEKNKYFEPIIGNLSNKVIIAIQRLGDEIKLSVIHGFQTFVKYFPYDHLSIQYLINTFWGGTLNMQETLTWSMKKIK